MSLSAYNKWKIYRIDEESMLERAMTTETERVRVVEDVDRTGSPFNASIRTRS